MKKAWIATMLVTVLAPTLALADTDAESLTAEQARACRWDGGLTPAQVADVFEAPGKYLGPEPEFPDRLLLGYDFGEGAGVVVGYLRGSGGRLISYSLNVVGFDQPDWFGEDCRAISKAHRPR